MSVSVSSSSSSRRSSSFQYPEPMFVKGETKLGSFLSLSENAKGRPREGMKRQSYIKKDRTSRKSSILSSLDKILDDGTVNTTDTSFSGRLSLNSDVSTTSARPPRMAQRRGSVTKYSLDQAVEQAESEDLAAAASFDNNVSVASFGTQKSDEPKPRLHKEKTTKLKKKRSSSLKEEKPLRSVATRNRSMQSLPDDFSSNTIDQRPVPMIDNSMWSLLNDGDDQSVATIDQLPLPLRHNHDSTESSNDEDQNIRRRSSTRSEASHSLQSIGEERPSSRPVRRKKSGKGSLAGLAGLTSLPNAALDYRLQDDRSVASSACGEEGRPRYLRRGPVTKLSLDADQMASLSSLPDDSADTMRHTSQDDRSIVSEQLPPRPRSRPSRSTSGKSKGSLTGLSSLPSTQSSSSDDRLQDDRSVVSSVGGKEGRARYRRRGSVTQFSLEATPV